MVEYPSEKIGLMVGEFLLILGMDIAGYKKPDAHVSLRS
jgi:hypothetical protein